MSDPSPILEYASPRLQHPFRLPTRSTVRVERTETGATITEIVAAKEGSIFAIGFAIFILAIYLISIVTELRHGIRDAVLFQGGFCAVYSALLLWVINETWTKTILTVEPDIVRLAFRSPLQRRSVDWPIDQIADVAARQVRLVDLPDSSNGGRRMAGEIVFTIRNSRPVPLFSGHQLENVQSLCYGIRQVLWPTQK